MSTTLNYSPHYLRKRKALLVYPVIVVPFLTLLFWIFGGGEDPQAAKGSNIVEGLNMQLPEANNASDSNWTKLNYYDKADKDSAKLRQLIKNDPYYDLPLTITGEGDSSLSVLLSHQAKRRGGMANHIYASTDSNEQKVYRQLAELDKALNNSVQTSPPVQPSIAKNQDIRQDEQQQLQHLMQKIERPPKEVDPEIEQLTQMIDKLAAIENPAQQKALVQEKSLQEKGKVFSVLNRTRELEVSLLGSDTHIVDSLGETKMENSFYDLTNGSSENTPAVNAIPALFIRDQTIVSGSTVQLQITADIFINGVHVPSGSLIYGMATLSAERLNVTVNSIRHLHHLFPVALVVYDLDGLPGIYIPGAISRDVAKQSADQSLSTMGLGSLDPSIGAQAASAGIQAAKSLISKKVKQIKVTVKAGYQVLLRDMNNQ